MQEGHGSHATNTCYGPRMLGWEGNKRTRMKDCGEEDAREWEWSSHEQVGDWIWLNDLRFLYHSLLIGRLSISCSTLCVCGQRDNKDNFGGWLSVDFVAGPVGICVPSKLNQYCQFVEDVVIHSAPVTYHSTHLAQSRWMSWGVSMDWLRSLVG